MCDKNTRKCVKKYIFVYFVNYYYIFNLKIHNISYYTV